MDFNKTVDLIIRDLDEAREIIDDLKSYPGVPAIQVEMAKAKCRNAAEFIALMKNMPENHSEEHIKVIRPPEPEHARAEKSIPIAEDAEPVHKRKEEAAEVRKEVIEKAPLPGKNNLQPGIFADTFIAPSDRLNENLGGSRDKDEIPDYFKSSPLANLSEAIGINDRFLFIRELFNGNSESYIEAIRNLDQARSLTDAKDILNSIAGDKSESEASRQLFDLVKRKFRIDE
jgi:hypothetical protein